MSYLVAFSSFSWALNLLFLEDLDFGFGLGGFDCLILIKIWILWIISFEGNFDKMNMDYQNSLMEDSFVDPLFGF